MIKIKACGICGSDLHLFRTDIPTRILLRNFINNIIKQNKNKKRILGHEISGIVIDSRDESFSIGDRVAVFPKTLLGNIGETLPGGFAEYVVVPSLNALKIPSHVSYEEGALLEPLGSALHAVKKQQQVLKKGAERALIIGAGTIGLMITMLIKHMRVADELYVSDKLPFRLKVAEELGADHTLTPAELSNYGNYFDIVFEAVGGFAIKTTLNQAIYVTKNGGVIILLGAVEISPKIKLGIFHVKEAHLIGSFTLTYQDYIDAYNMVNSKLLRLSRLITHQFPLSEVPKAIRVALSHPESIKSC